MMLSTHGLSMCCVQEWHDEPNLADLDHLQCLTCGRVLAPNEAGVWRPTEEREADPC